MCLGLHGNWGFDIVYLMLFTNCCVSCRSAGPLVVQPAGPLGQHHDISTQQWQMEATWRRRHDGDYMKMPHDGDYMTRLST